MSKVLSHVAKNAKLTSIEEIGGIYCHICHFKFGNKKIYDSHYSNHETLSEIIYTCVICYKQIPNYSSFRGHCYTKHLLKEKMRCVHCNKTFSKLSSLQHHIGTMHKHKCPFCEQEFSSKREMELHRIIHDYDKPPFECQMCEEHIDTVETCEIHIELHCQFKYTCPICNEITISKNDATDHLNVHFDNVVSEIDDTLDTDEQLISQDSSIDLLGILCCYCDIVCKNRTELDLHFETNHTGINIVYSCNICGKQYDKYPLFAHHCYFHYAKDKFRCVKCDKTFDRLSLLVVHTEMFHNESENSVKPFNCTECQEKFATETRMRRHLRNAHSVYNLKCSAPGCGALFETTRCLVIHQRSHNAISNNCCKECGLQFTSISSCIAHLNLHRTKNYTCPVCSKSYAEKYLMMKHVPQHFEAVLHICKVCGKVFNAKHRLVQHAKIHTASKDNICSQCGKAFSTPQALKQHLYLHDTFKPFKCTVCPKSFAAKPNWWKHIKNMHKIDPKSVSNTDVTNSKSINLLNNLDENGINVIDNNQDRNLQEEIINIQPASSCSSGDNNVDVGSETQETTAGDDVSNCNLIEMLSNYDMEAGSNNFTPNDYNGYELGIQENIEHGIDIMCSELLNENSVFDDNNVIEGEVELDSICPSITDKETQIFRENSQSYIEYTKVLLDSIPIDIHTEPTQEDTVTTQSPISQQTIPLEYGPDFISNGMSDPHYSSFFIDLEGCVPPHIDPLLTIKSEQLLHSKCSPNTPYPDDNFETTIRSPWHPQVVKVQHDYDFHFGQLTDNANRLTFF